MRSLGSNAFQLAVLCLGRLTIAIFCAIWSVFPNQTSLTRRQVTDYMAKFAKHQRKAVRNKLRGVRVAIAERSPNWLRRTAGPIVLYGDMLLADHGIFRLFYLNRHQLAPQVWRAAQPAPHNINALARKGLRTVINLRGKRVCGSYWLEEKACAARGIELIDYQVRSRAAPSKPELRGAKDLLERVERPFLMHCKSGADRAGLMSVLYCIFVLKQPVEEAAKQLSLKFGHIRQADTGILDYFFERYIDYNKQHPIAFMDWVETVYDPEEVKAAFHAKSAANVLVNKVLRRE